jgi:Na+:H+ antiporter, NhaA family
MKKAASSLNMLFTPLRYFFKNSKSVGILLICCTICSIIFSNFDFSSNWYSHLWQSTLAIPSSWKLPDSTLLWINDGLMTIFFFLVGMEIKREFRMGELASVKKSLLPIIAAIGGMVVPALFFNLFNNNTAFHHGWGIPMATDIAFSLGVLSLLGKKVPVQLKIFLAALAIIDDLGAVITIAVFYSHKLNLYYLFGALSAITVVILMNRARIKPIFYYLFPAIILWYCLFNSGVHATIAGVAMAFCMPLSQLSKVEKLLFYPVNFVIMPLFALANTAILLPPSFGPIYTSSISLGVMMGLIFGKPIGIFMFSFIASKMGIASLPSHTNYKHLWGIGMIGGIGFTMSIFTSTLSYSTSYLQTISKVSIMTASLIAGLLGFIYLRRLLHSNSSFILVKDQFKMEAEKPAYSDKQAVA